MTGAVKKLKHSIRRIPLIGSALAHAFVWIAGRRFHGSAQYWDKRYQAGGDSGDGSYGELAQFKADILNGLVEKNGIKSVVEFGCGDGNQLRLAAYPDYVGLDVSQRAIDLCEKLFVGDSTKSFQLMQDYRNKQAELALSLDVIYHLVEDQVFGQYMETLFAAAQKMVVIYASNTDVQDIPQPPHVRHRCFTDWVLQHAADWQLSEVIENRFPYDPVTGEGSAANFYLFEKGPS